MRYITTPPIPRRKMNPRVSSAILRPRGTLCSSSGCRYFLALFDKLAIYTSSHFIPSGNKSVSELPTDTSSETCSKIGEKVTDFISAISQVTVSLQLETSNASSTPTFQLRNSYHGNERCLQVLQNHKKSCNLELLFRQYSCGWQSI